MEFNRAIEGLKSLPIPSGWKGDLFLLPESGMRAIYDCIRERKLRSCIELGTGFGATTCTMAAAMEENGGGRVTTIDMYLHEPINVNVARTHLGLRQEIEVVAERLGYIWVLADWIAQQSRDGVCTPSFDFCLIDGAHEWQPDGLAFTLVTKLLKPGGILVLDDLNFNLRMVPNWSEVFGNHSDRELDAFQMKMVWDLLVRPSADYHEFRVTEHGRMGWAEKRTAVVTQSKGRWKRIFGAVRSRSV